MRASLRSCSAVLALGLCFSLGSGLALATDVPPLRAHVNDYAQLLSADRAAALEARLADYEQRTKHQFALLSVASLSGDTLEGFSMRVAERWKLGHKGKDDGLILLVVPSEHKMRIEVGYGLEGVIPDAIAARVIREVLAPAFRRGDFAGGVDAAFGALMHAAGGEGPGAGPSAAAPKQQPETLWGLLAPLLFPLLFFILIGMSSRGRGGGFWTALALGSMMRGGGGFGDRGGGGFGGGGGGGFGGGGGGSFGGGGASGGW
jgi:uncharacterized protein